LEEAIGNAFPIDGNFRGCEIQDLCLQDKQYRVFNFLRSISPSKKHNEVLHLHGYYQNRERMIVTRNDYLEAYEENSADGDDVKPKRILDTLHRKVVWSVSGIKLTILQFEYLGYPDEIRI